MPEKIDRFEIQEELGEGGFGKVYRAFDPQLDRDVAIKIIQEKRIESALDHERFVREARAAANLNHPSIVQVYELIELEEGQGYVIVMEYVEGERLYDAIHSGTLTLPKAFELFRQIAEGLAVAHESGIVHRDLKAENVMINRGGHAKILDFGLAKRLAGGEASLTTEGTMVGTFHAMSPEQIDPHRTVDHRSDLFSLGSLAYQMVTGRAPFLAKDQSQTTTNVVALRQPPASSVDSRVPGVLSDLIDELLEKNPDRRPQTAEAVASKLKQLAKLQLEVLSSSSAKVGSPKGPLPHTPSEATTLPMPSAGRFRATLVFRVVLVLALAASLAGVGYVLPLWNTPPSVAILGFEDLSESGVPSSAVAEVLAEELAVDSKVRVIDEERVAEVKNDLGLTAGQLLDADTLAEVRRHLVADYLAVGSLEATNGARRLHLKLQETDDGEVAWQGAFSSPNGDLFTLSAMASDGLRQELDAGALSPEQREQVRDLFPSGDEAARLYFEGRDRLRRLEPVEAREALEKAVVLQPEHPRILTALAAALWEAGQAQEAIEAARKASELAARWPRRQRLEIEGRYHELADSWDEAAAVYQELFLDFPGLETGLRLAEAQVETTAWSPGERTGARSALETLDELRQMRLSERDQARIALTESRARYDLRDYARAKEAAEQAATIGERLGATFLAARARFAQGRSLAKLRDSTAALEVLKQVRVEYEKTGYPVGVQDTFHLIALLHVQRDELAEATRDLERYVAFYENDPEAFTGVRHLCNVLTDLGHHVAARTLLQVALGLMEPMESLDLADASLVFGFIAQSLGDLTEAEKHYNEALSAFDELDEEWSMAVALTNLGEVRFLAGDLRGALELHQKALEINRELDDEGAGYDLFRLGKVQAAMGDSAGAAASYRAALDLWGDEPRPSDVAHVQLARAELQLNVSNFSTAAELAREAHKAFLDAEMIDNAIEAQAFLGHARLKQDRTRDARKQAQTVLGHAARSESWAARFAADLLEARVRAASREADDVDRALAALERLAGEAARLGFVGYAFEARLAQAEAEDRSGRLDAAKARLEILIEDAEKQGYGMIAGRAEKLLGQG